MSTSTFGAVAEAASELLKLINSYVNPSQQKAAANLRADWQGRMEEFCDAVRRGDGVTCSRLIAGLRVSAPLPELTDGEFDRLRYIVPRLDGSTLAALYIRAAQGSYAADLADLISSARSQGNGSVASTAIQSATNVASAVADSTQ